MTEATSPREGKTGSASVAEAGRTGQEIVSVARTDCSLSDARGINLGTAQPSTRERQENGGGVGVGVCVGVRVLLLVAEGLSVLDGLTVVDAAGVLEAGALALEGPLTDAKAVLDDIAVADEEGRAEGLAQRRILMTLNHISGM